EAPHRLTRRVDRRPLAGDYSLDSALSDFVAGRSAGRERAGDRRRRARPADAVRAPRTLDFLVAAPPVSVLPPAAASATLARTARPVAALIRSAASIAPCVAFFTTSRTSTPRPRAASAEPSTA